MRKSTAERNKSIADHPALRFSYSGIKTAVLRYVEIHDMKRFNRDRRQALANIRKAKARRSIWRPAIKQTLDSSRFISACRWSKIWWAKLWQRPRRTMWTTLFVTGGVAANSELRNPFEQSGAQEGVPVFFPSRALSTDNAAMIAAAAYPKFLAKDFAAMDFSAEASLRPALVCA